MRKKITLEKFEENKLDRTKMIRLVGGANVNERIENDNNIFGVVS